MLRNILSAGMRLVIFDIFDSGVGLYNLSDSGDGSVQGKIATALLESKKRSLVIIRGDSFFFFVRGCATQTFES